MTAVGLGSSDEDKLAAFLVEKICDRASGRSESECHRNYPRDVYFIGNLRPRDDAAQEQDHDPGYLRELRTKLAPVAFGIEFLARPVDDSIVVEVTVRWATYYRVFPTLDQQRSQSRLGQSLSDTTQNGQSAEAGNDRPRTEPQSASEDLQSASGEEPDDEGGSDESPSAEQAPSPESEDTPTDRRRSRAPRDSLFIRFKRIPCQAAGRVVCRTDERNHFTIDVSELQDALDDENERAQRLARTDNERLRTSAPGDHRVQVPDTALRSELDYRHFLNSLTSEVIPEWKLGALAELRANDSGDIESWVFRLELVNASPRQIQQGEERDNPTIEAFLFDARITLGIAKGALLPFELELAPRSFRYSRDLWGRGFNCAVQRSGEAELLETTHAPVHLQKRYTTRTSPPAMFAELSRDPMPTLEAVGHSMDAYLETWREAAVEYSANMPGWKEFHEELFNKDLDHFKGEIARYRKGVELITSDADMRLAFQLTNEAFRRAGSHSDPAKRKDSWRLFQLVFLIGQMPGIWTLAHSNSGDAAERSIVDIIYFPTGGGKTEAYLATIVFHCFFDRLRGKTAGVTAWTRFPLRLLTLQQTQRVADVLGIAELVRREQSDPRLAGKDVAGFAVGYFVGKESTPNQLINPAQYRYYISDEDRANWSRANDATARQGWKRVTRCPACRTSTIRLDFDISAVRLIHRCTNQGCAFPNGEIPCYVIDNEIYRFLPAVILGTIDKLAGLGNQRKVAQIFGQVDGRCRVHGFYKGKCVQKDCVPNRGEAPRLQAGAPRGISGPTLFVQDELHLLKEGLGTFDSHYESFVVSLRREFGQADSLKIIASSATIEAFDRQVQHLYSRQSGQARVFPGFGPRLGESFYAQTLDLPQRLFVGILPHNKTIFNAILEILEFYHREVQALSGVTSGANPYRGVIAPGSTEWTSLLEKYVTSVTYFLAGRDLNSIRTDINGDVNPSLSRDGLREIDLYELTGDTQSDDVTAILEKLEAPARELPSATGVLATSMISHGVDVDRLNCMIFYGMPRHTAEYIQSSSRVGRTHVGIVLTCLHPARERDQSHYTYFTKYHEFLGQLVEPVAINRWATFSIQRTLPGLFMAVLLQVLANRRGGREVDKYYLIDFVKREISTGALRHEMFYPLLEDAYLAQGGSPVGIETFRTEIRERIPHFFDQILSSGPENRFVSQVLIPAPMRSLRDVDEVVWIELDATGTTWAGR